MFVVLLQIKQGSYQINVHVELSCRKSHECFLGGLFVLFWGCGHPAWAMSGAGTLSWSASTGMVKGSSLTNSRAEISLHMPQNLSVKHLGYLFACLYCTSFIILFICLKMSFMYFQIHIISEFIRKSCCQIFTLWVQLNIVSVVIHPKWYIRENTSFFMRNVFIAVSPEFGLIWLINSDPICGGLTLAGCQAATNYSITTPPQLNWGQRIRWKIISGLRAFYKSKRLQIHKPRKKDQDFIH